MSRRPIAKLAYCRHLPCMQSDTSQQVRCLDVCASSFGDLLYRFRVDWLLVQKGGNNGRQPSNQIFCSLQL